MVPTELAVVPLVGDVALTERGVHFDATSVGLHVVGHEVYPVGALSVVSLTIVEMDGIASHAIDFTPKVLSKAYSDGLTSKVFLCEQLAAVVSFVLLCCNGNSSNKCGNVSEESFHFVVCWLLYKRNVFFNCNYFRLPLPFKHVRSGKIRI